jgi:hypothetical protein
VCRLVDSASIGLESSRNGQFLVEGRLVVVHGHELDFLIPFQSSGDIVVAGGIELHSYTHYIDGTLNVLKEGSIKASSGHLNIAYNISLLGEGNIALIGGSSTMHAKSNKQDTVFRLFVGRGSHELEIDDNSPPRIEIYELPGESHGQLTLGCTHSVCEVDTMHSRHYMGIIVKDNSTVHVSELILNGISSLKGPGVLMTDTLIWRGGTVSSGANVTVIGVSVFNSLSSGTIQQSVLSLLGKVYVTNDDCTTITLHNTKFTIGPSCVVSVGSCFQLYDLGNSIVQNFGTVIMSIPDVGLISQASVVNEGTIVAGNNVLQFKELNSNGHVDMRGSGQIIYDTGTSPITEGLSYNISGETSYVDITNGAELTCHRSYFPFPIYGSWGKFIVPQNISCRGESITITAGFVVQVDGVFEVNQVILDGGVIEGDGTFKAGSFTFISGSVGIDHAICQGNTTFMSSSEKRIISGRVTVSGDLILRDGSVITMSGSSMLVIHGNMQMQLASGIESTDTSSLLLNVGSIEVNAGPGRSKSRLHVHLQNDGNITVASGHFEMGWNEFAVSCNGSFLVAEEAQLTFSGGNQEIGQNCEFLAYGHVYVDRSTARVSIEDGDAMVHFTALSVVQGVFENGRKFSNSIEEIHIEGGELICNSPIKVHSFWIRWGQLTIKSYMEIHAFQFHFGILASDHRQSQITANTTKWIGGVFSTFRNKRLTLESKELIIISNNRKAIEGSVNIIASEYALFASGFSVRVSSGAHLTVGSNAIFVVVGGEVVSASQTDGSFVNDGRLEIGLQSTISSNAAFGALFVNNGQMVVKNVQVTYSNGGNLGNSGVNIHSGSKIRITSGTMVISPETFESSTQIDVLGGVLTLTPGDYAIRHQFTLKGGQVLFSGDNDSEDIDINFDADILLIGGILNVSSESIMTGVLEFRVGSIIGQGAIIFSSGGELIVSFSNSAGDARTVAVSLLECESICKVYSPMSISGSGVMKISEESTLRIQSYATISGDGHLLNMGSISVEVNDAFQSQLSPNIHNYWNIGVASGQLRLDTTENAILLYDTSLIKGTDISLCSGVHTSGVLETKIDGNIAIRGATYVIGTTLWTSGTISLSTNPCTSNYYPPINSLLVPPCTEQYILVQDTLVIGSSLDKAIEDGVRIINEGVINWRSGKLRVGQATIMNSGKFAVNSTNEFMLWERLVSYRQSYFTNNGDLIIANPKVTMGTALTNNRHVSVCSGCSLKTDSFTQNMDDARLSGEDIALIGSMNIYGGSLECSGAIDGQVVLDSAKLITRGKQ